jgi:hypothetical protein
VAGIEECHGSIVCATSARCSTAAACAGDSESGERPFLAVAAPADPDISELDESGEQVFRWVREFIPSTQVRILKYYADRCEQRHSRTQCRFMACHRRHVTAWQLLMYSEALMDAWLLH